MYKKAATNYVVTVKSYHQLRGNDLTFLLEKPRNYRQIRKPTSLRGKLMNPVVSRARSVSAKIPYQLTW